MSMFHELMMRKKEETLYPVIKGSLTESPSGVFSGFSTSNYITMPITPSELSNCSIKLRFTTANVNTEQDIIWLKRNNENIASYFGLQTHPNGNHCYMYSYAPGASSYVATSFELLSNTTYDCVINIENGKLSWKIGEPNNLIEQNQMNFDVSSIASFDNPICFGSLLNTGYAFNGSIDFNNSYIILNGTKYNLQAVVGYTVVGSPTITDGVVSGFSSANYLQCLPNLPNYTKLERFVKFNTGTTTTNTRTIIGSSPYGSINLEATTNKIRTTIFVSPTYATMTLNTALAQNTIYYYKDILENGIVTGFLYDSNKNLIESKTSALGNDTGRYLIIGKTTNSERPFTNGSVYLNETYVKVDNKLWFNGQQS